MSYRSRRNKDLNERTVTILLKPRVYIYMSYRSRRNKDLNERTVTILLKPRVYICHIDHGETKT